MCYIHLQQLILALYRCKQDLKDPPLSKGDGEDATSIPGAVVIMTQQRLIRWEKKSCQCSTFSHWLRPWSPIHRQHPWQAETRKSQHGLSAAISNSDQLHGRLHHISKFCVPSKGVGCIRLTSAPHASVLLVNTSQTTFRNQESGIFYFQRQQTKRYKIILEQVLHWGCGKSQISNKFNSHITKSKW